MQRSPIRENMDLLEKSAASFLNQRKPDLALKILLENYDLFKSNREKSPNDYM